MIKATLLREAQYKQVSIKYIVSNQYTVSLGMFALYTIF